MFRLYTDILYILFCVGKGRCFAILKKVRPFVKQFFQRADMFLLGVCLVSALFGTAMVFRAATGMVASGAELSPPGTST